MKFKNLNLVVSIAAILMMGLTQVRAEDKTLHSQVAKLYRTAEHLFNTKNAAALNAAIAPDFKGKGMMGMADSHDSMVQHTNQMCQQMKTIHAKFTVLNSHKAGRNIVVNTRYLFNTVTNLDDKGKSHKMIVRGTCTQTWLHEGDKWLMKSYTEGKNSKVFWDGKLMDPNKMKPNTKSPNKD